MEHLIQNIKKHGMEMNVYWAPWGGLSVVCLFHFYSHNTPWERHCLYSTTEETDVLSHAKGHTMMNDKALSDYQERILSAPPHTILSLSRTLIQWGLSA